MKPAISERLVVFLVGAVQFINILDFTMVMPLGPDFTGALGIRPSEMGLITGAYTAAAAVAGFAGSLFLDRFDRRSALAVAMLGLGVGTAAGGFATDLHTLVAARVAAGLFGGPATSVALSIIADVIPRERRGKAMGAVAGAFSVAQVVGIPAGLRLARATTLSWRLPFFAVAALGLLVTFLAITALPKMRGHLRAEGTRPATVRESLAALGALLARPTVRLSYAMTAAVMFAGFIVLPSLPVYLTKNLQYPRARFELLYAIGGATTFVTNRLLGRLVDRVGSFPVGTAGALLGMMVMYFYLIAPWPGMPVLPVFVTYMVVLGARNVAYNALTTQVPRPEERARFLSLQSTVYHVASSLGALSSSRLLSVDDRGALVGMPIVALISMGLTLLFPVLLYNVARRVKAER